MLSVRNLKKIYKTSKNSKVTALNNVSIDFPEKGFIFLLGKSGSGKSTLLNSIGGLDTFDDGEIIIKGKSSKDFTQSDFDSYRNTFIGFIFQEYNILENFTVAKNIALALELQGKKADKNEVMRLLEQVDLQNFAKRKPNQLSGGQKQRVAIARALIKDPEIIMADEPTGALDSNTGKQVMDTLKKLSKSKLVIVVSHDREFAEIYGDRIIELKDGKIISDVTKKEIESKTTSSGIKVIDNNIVYVKQGQQLSNDELQAISKIISTKSKTADTFISFDKDANKKLKEGAKINDDGNKEKFLDTQPEDIQTKQYNPKSLKLIKSRLKFADSFKMGSSSLKSKVGKLIFTIILSFITFTIFGIVDAFSCWNRADSVYQAMKLTNQTNLVMLKQKKITSNDYSYNQTKLASDEDISSLKQQFPAHFFKPVVNSQEYSYYSISAEDSENNSINLKTTSNPYKQLQITGYTVFSDEDLNKLGFSIVKGRLPQNENEIAISKHIMNNLISLSSESSNKITVDNITTIKINPLNSYLQIVGVIDDKTDTSKYENMKDTDWESMSGYSLQNSLKYSYINLAYVSQAKFDEIKQSSSDSLSVKIIGSTWYTNCDCGDFYSPSTIENIRNIMSMNDEYYFNNEKNALLIKSSEYDLEVYTKDYECRYWYNNWTIRKRDTNQTVSLNSELEALLKDSTNDGINLPDGFVKQEKYNINMFAIQHLVYGDLYNADGSLKELADDEIILTYNFNSSYTLDEMKEKIDERTLYISLFEGYDLNESSTIKNFKVVGLFSSYINADFIISDNCLNQTVLPQFGSYEFILSSLNGSTQDRALVGVCENFNNENIKYTIQNSTTSIMDSLEGFIDSSAKVFFYIGLGFAVLAALILMNFISTSISYKKREIGVLRALGARGSDIFGIFFNESSIIAFINFVLASIATFITCKIINISLLKELGMEITLLNVSIRQVILILLVSYVSAFLASIIPTSKISKKKPIDAINNR